MDFHTVKVGLCLHYFWKKLRISSFHYFIFSFYLLDCDCNQEGSNSVACDNNGKCSCKSNITGNKCQKCIEGFVGFPDCQSRFILQYFWKKFSHSTIILLIWTILRVWVHWRRCLWWYLQWADRKLFLLYWILWRYLWNKKNQER